jgi:hypothetical protein
MNLTALQAAIQAKGYGTDTAAQQILFINEVYREVCGLNRWKFLEGQDTSLTTIVSQQAYNLSSTAGGGINLNGGAWRNLDAVRIEIAPLIEYNNLKYKQPEEFMELWEIDRDVSTPYYWTFYTQQLWLYPVPDNAYTVRIDYIIEPPDLSLGTDVPLIPTQYHDILVWGAVENMAYRERDWLGRQFAEQKKAKMIQQLEEEYWIQQRQTSNQVRRSGYWDVQMPYPFIHDGF